MRSAIASSSRIAVNALRPPRARPAVRALSTSTCLAAPRVGMARGVDFARAAMPRLPGQQVRTMFIQTETTPNEASLKFIPGVEVMPGGGTHEVLDLRGALGSPLATRLLNVDGVVGVFFGPDFVTCSKDENYNWSVLKPEVFAILMEHFASGAPLFKEGHESSGAEDTRVLDTDSEVVAMIKELLETRVRPAIMEDGGDIEYRGFSEDSGIVQLKLKGSCRGCSSSEVTLKNGIERMLMHYVPEVQGVEQFLDEEERIALDEFNKLEARLAKDKKAEANP
ncbi:HIRA-interacting protein 5 [Cutaneotrichosporon oleaginosum]|uniref:HIRA-interacting protein 5 n=1 Tax=Cutaneotrichosporon oleaginosum TaxID=879819 RepID=A0A0J0XZ23_9TREE|nr:HIRA-interacting protein 5 [Cutaneotrichosporon oleaginosum]KLT46313.1 HIRA-interacting protein 5 [Cutaneotrichosporon oleaginosum]TXT10314.1 hypothetical protein COLE_04248 [Cutaneotrichosporon oleaginosum]